MSVNGTGMEMATAKRFDSLKSKESLESNGLDPLAAAAIAKELSKVVSNDLGRIKNELDTEIKSVRVDLSQIINDKSDEIMSKITVKVGAMLAGGLGLLITLMTTLHLIR